jgi:aryl-alcohol dehydrogenase-like predicted oxidoreductase
MARLQREGKVRWIGVSNFNVEEMKRAQAVAPIASLQPPYSLIRREIEEEILPFCERQGIGVIVYSPMASGLLTGAMSRERVARLADDDWRKRHPDFQEPRLLEHLALVERLRAVGATHGRSPGESRHRVDARPPGGDRGDRRCSQREAGGRRHGRCHAAAH